MFMLVFRFKGFRHLVQGVKVKSSCYGLMKFK